MRIKTLTIGPMENKCYIITDEATGDTAVIDPSFKSHILLEALEPVKDKVKLILLTHRHFDHVLGAAGVKELTGAKTAIHELDKEGLYDASVSRAVSYGLSSAVQTPVQPDILLQDGDTLELGETTVRVIHTPGHTAGGVCYQIGDSLFTGDTLFREEIGRDDLPTGDAAALERSLAKIKTLDVDQIYPGHGDATKLEHELRYNPYMRD